MQLEMLLAFLSAFTLFIYAVKSLTKEIEEYVRDEIKNKFLKFRNKLFNILAGFFVTSILQSSSTFSVIVISLISASAITLKQAIALMIGSNVGSTVLTQIVSFKLFFLSPILIVFGFFISFFRSYSILGRALFLLGLVIFSLDEIKKIGVGITDLKNFLNEQDNLILFAISFITTVIIQSSGIVISIASILALDEVISTYKALFIILGANLGTVSTAFFASIGKDKYAKAVVQFHFLFNAFIVFIGFLFFQQVHDFSLSISEDKGRFVANAHTLLNLLSAIFFVLTFEIVEKKLRALNNIPEQVLLEIKHLEEEENVEKRIRNIKNEIKDYLQIMKAMAIEIKETAEKGKVNGLVNKYYVYSSFIYDEIATYISSTKISEKNKKFAKQLSYMLKLCSLIKDLSNHLKNIYDSLSLYKMDTTEKYVIVKSMEETVYALEMLEKKADKEIGKKIRDKLHKLADVYYTYIIGKIEKGEINYKEEVGKIFFAITEIEKTGSEISMIYYTANKIWK